MTPEDLLKQGRLDDCLKAVEASVRKNPADAKARVSLFQVLAVLGDWDRASNQLGVAAELDHECILMSQVCQPAIMCERLRQEIFAGKRTPLILGEPEPWMGMVVQAAVLTAQGKAAAGEELRTQAFESAPTIAGEIDVGPKEGETTTHAFEWIADADPLLGPMLEAIVDGKYYWVPWQRISMLRLEAPEDLRDTVWLPGQVIWTTGAQQVVLVPARYSGSETAQFDSGIRMGRRTEFVDRGGWEGPVGQRMLATDAGEFGVLQTRAVRLGEPPEGEQS
jgi:type VI secretion system protein ImpE